MAFKKYNPGSCDACGTPVVCPQQPGVNMYLYHEIESDPGVGYISRIHGTKYKWTVEDPSQLSGQKFVDGSRTLWTTAAASGYFGGDAWWVSASGDTGHWNLATEFGLGDFGSGGTTHEIYLSGDGGVANWYYSGSTFAPGGGGIYCLIREEYSAPGDWASDADVFTKIYLGRITTTGCSKTLIVQTSHHFSGGVIDAAESFFVPAIAGGESNPTVFLLSQRTPGTIDSDGERRFRIFFGTTQTESFTGSSITDFTVPSVIGVQHMYGDHSLAYLNPDIEWNLLEDGQITNPGVFPLASDDINYIFARGIVSSANTKLFDIDGGEQTLAVEFQDTQVVAVGEHLAREYYWQQWNGDNNFTEKNFATGVSATGDIEWPDAYLPTTEPGGELKKWWDYYEFPNGVIQSLLPISEFA